MILALIIASGKIGVPESFGIYTENIAYEWYRGEAVVDEALKNTTYTGRDYCSKCHLEEYNMLVEGLHKTLTCEVCHGPGVGHPEEVEELPVNTSYRNCLVCHGILTGRPKGFPQIDYRDHFNFDPEKMECIQCHNPHTPKGG